MKVARVAWRLRAVALQASILPFALMFLLHYLEQEVLLFMAGPELLVTIIEVMQFALEALVLGMILEASLAVGGLPAWRQVVRPSGRAWLFAVAMAPVGLAGLLLQGALTGWVVDHYMARLDGDLDAHPDVALVLLSEIASAPAATWLLAGVVAAPLALATLRPPRLAAPPRAVPNLPFLATLLVAVMFTAAVEAGIAGAAARLPLALLGELGTHVAWYVGRMLLLTAVAAGIGVMLVRRAAQPADA